MTRNETQLPIAILRESLNAADDGSLFWLHRPAEHFSASARRSAKHVAANWNARYAGRPALTCVTPFGHKTGRLNGLMVYAHRAVWALHTGQWPMFEIDHIDGDSGNNRVSNLRDVPHLENLRNQAMRKNNTTGFNGVSHYRRDGNYVASIVVGGKSVHLGYFASPKEANAARLAANAEHQFHANHGRRAA